MIKWRNPTISLREVTEELYKSMSVVKRLSSLLALGFVESETQSF